MNRNGYRLILSVLCLMCAPKVMAQALGPGCATAKECFSRGVQLARDGDLEGAVRDFEQAYTLHPAPDVLFNLGQTYSALGRPVEALETLRRFLDSEGSRVSHAERELAEQAIRFNRARLGWLSVHVYPRGAHVDIDGRPVDLGTEPIPLVAGPHTILVSHPEYETSVKALEVPRSDTLALDIVLTPSSHVLTAALASSGQIATECGVPAVTVEIDGRPRSGVLHPVLPGPHPITFRRAGYVPMSTTVAVRSGETETVHCAMRLDPAQGSSRGRIRVRVEPSDSRIVIDGESRSEAELPPGQHAIEVSRTGYLARRQEVSLASRQNLEFKWRLAALGPPRSAPATAQTQRTWAIVLAGTGLAAFAGAGIAWFAADRRYQDWRHDREGLAANASGVSAQGMADTYARLGDGAVDIQRLDTLAIGLGVVGLGLTVAATTLYFQAKGFTKTESFMRRKTERRILW